MPLSKYYGGKGASVMKDMQGRYGADKGKRVFYATANKEDQAEKKVRRKKKRHARKRRRRYSHARSPRG